MSQTLSLEPAIFPHHRRPAGLGEGRALKPGFGAVYENADLTNGVTAELAAQLHEALLQHGVIFFRNQDITPRQHRALGAALGPLHIHPVYPAVADVPEAIILDTELNDLKDNALWHTDVTFSQTPPLGAVLVARHLPPTGGDTLWASGELAYQALSPRMKYYLDGLEAVHDFTRSFPLQRFGTTPEALVRWQSARDANPPVTHPIIRIHPETGARALFVNEGFTTQILGLEDDESSAILRYLFAHYARPEFQIRWSWRAGDVAIWDNRNTQHYATDDYRPARRIMHRVTILGDRPVGPQDGSLQAS